MGSKYTTADFCYNAHACVTMDLEPDFSQFHDNARHYGVFDMPGQFERLCGLIKKHDVKLTCFVVGVVLRERPDYVRELSRLGVEFACHSLTHILGEQESEREVRGGIDAFAAFFGHLPQGYRSPCGRLSWTIMRMLEEQGIKYDSSVYPSVMAGGYWNLEKPTGPFRWNGLSLIELPISSIPYLHLPMALSYMKLLGPALYSSLLEVLGYPKPFVLLFHPHDLIVSAQAHQRLSLAWRLVYFRKRWSGFQTLDSFLMKLRSNGYRFTFMRELYDQTCNTLLPKTISVFPNHQ